MINLTYNQKIAALRILLDIVQADGRIHEREVSLFQEIRKELGIEEAELDEVHSYNSLVALGQVRDFTESQKKLFIHKINQMVIVDDDINPNEVYIYNLVCEFCKLTILFDPKMN